MMYSSEFPALKRKRSFVQAMFQLIATEQIEIKTNEFIR